MEHLERGFTLAVILPVKVNTSILFWMLYSPVDMKKYNGLENQWLNDL